MPTLREPMRREMRPETVLLDLQRAMRKSILACYDGEIVAMLAEGVSDRLNVYRNTVMAGLTNALRLSFPAVLRLVGPEFFEGAAAIFVAEHAPRAACLDHYGAEFPDFLGRFPPAASLAYLADVARLELLANRALHAADVRPLALDQLAAVPPQDYHRVRFDPHPAVGLLRADAPVDRIWRAVLDADDAGLATLDLDAGPVCLLVERPETSVEVRRLPEPAWRFAADLFAGLPLAALDRPDVDAPVLLAEHLVAQRFVGFSLTDTPADPMSETPMPRPEVRP